MTGEGGADTRPGVHALASPVFVGALVLLALNDHVLKAVWPGVVTGKLSDVAGLVVAPVLLAVLLAPWRRVRRPDLVALAATGAGFTLVKTTAAGAAAASATWSAVAGPSYHRADPTDLVALPALLVAARVLGQARRSRAGRRRQASAVVGAVVLPFAVLATAATSPCDTGGSRHTVDLVEGRWSDGEVGSRLVLDGELALVVAGNGLLAEPLTARDRQRLPQPPDHADVACAPDAPRLCWRVSADGYTLEVTRDGGRRWSAEETLSAEDVDALRDEVGEVCGRPAEVRVDDVAVGEGGRMVVATLQHGGVLVRLDGGSWDRVGDSRLDAWAGPAPSMPPDAPREPRGRLRLADVPTPTVSAGADTPPGSPSSQPTQPPRPHATHPGQLPCSSPRTVTVTPDPRNGPPTTYLRC